MHTHHYRRSESVRDPAGIQSGAGIRIAIESILGQTWQNLELLIVDDCSPDDTKAIAEEYAARDPRVRVLSTPRNSGPYVARNIALEAADGEFVTVNDADDWSHSQKIEVQARHLMDHPKVVANTSGHARLTEELTLYRRGHQASISSRTCHR
ncbi:glycosyltransferase family 2 protein [Salinicoccus sp. CNSTN-B1]